MKEMKNLSKWRDIPCSWKGRLNIVKMPFFPTLVNRFNVIQIKISANYLVDVNKLILKYGKAEDPK